MVNCVILDKRLTIYFVQILSEPQIQQELNQEKLTEEQLKQAANIFRINSD